MTCKQSSDLSPDFKALKGRASGRGLFVGTRWSAVRRWPVGLPAFAGSQLAAPLFALARVVQEHAEPTRRRVAWKEWGANQEQKGGAIDLGLNAQRARWVFRRELQDEGCRISP